MIKPAPGLALRVLRFPLVLLVLEFFALTALAALASMAVRQWTARNTPLQVLGALGIAAVVALGYFAATRWLEGRRGGGELALEGAPRELGLGLASGFVLFSAVTGVVALLGGFEVLGMRGQGQLWSMLAMAIVSGMVEELLFRGVVLRHLEGLLGSWAALAITAALFGLAHFTNPHAGWFAALAIAMEAGILLGAAYYLTSRLWLAIGIHAAWNFTQGWVFSVPVSGSETPLGLLITRRAGPDWLTGGEFGLEASVVAMVLATLAGLLMLRRAATHDGLRPPLWRR